MTSKDEHSHLKRRDFLRGLLIATLGVIAAGSLVFRDKILRSRWFRRRPNIIFILADDLGYNDLGSYGQQRIRTPNLDALAAEGMRFTQCYAGAPACAPSRFCLMTGLHTGHARIRANTDASGERISLRPEDFTVAELLKSAGYVTGIAGKWHLAIAGTDGVPNKQGFDEWLGHLQTKDTNSYYPEFLWRNEEKVWIGENQNGKEVVYSQDLFTLEALDFIRAHQNHSFFLYLPYSIPHAPLEVPSDEPYSAQPWPQVEKNFAAMITRMDRDVGKILSLLIELGLDKDTVVFFSSDNGPHEEGGHDMYFFDSQGPLRGRKRSLYEGGIRVPMIVRWPGVIEPGTVSDQVWALWDFLPTAAKIAGVKLPENMEFDGISMLPSLLGKKQQNREFLYWEFYIRSKGRLDQAVRMGNWKGIRQGSDANINLYNLEEDISEKHDLAAEHPDVVAAIAQIMDISHAPSPDYPEG